MRTTPIGRRLSIACVAVIWLGAVAWGFGRAMQFESQSGLEAASLAAWPRESRLLLEDGWNLVMFLHPHCPCSRASVSGLAEMQAQTARRLKITFVFCKPEGAPENWEQTSVVQQAVMLADAKIFWDEADRERRLFGAMTSGQVLMFDGRGRLRYQGGITRGRGQVGSSAGRDFIERLVRGESISDGQQPVFGCPLVEIDD